MKLSLRGLIQRNLRERTRRIMQEIQLLPRRSNILNRGLPDFLIIGAQKSGTTSLYNYLVQHPKVRPSLMKEIHFFDIFYNRGTDWYRAHFPSDNYPHDFLVGEATPYYIFHPLCPQRIASLVPNAKLLVLLRNPIDRAYSHYKHEIRLHYEWLSFEEAIKQESERLAGKKERMLTNDSYQSFSHQHHSYLARGRYFEQLQIWFQLFPREQFFIIDSDSFRVDTESIYSEVLDFLNLPMHSIDIFKLYYSSKSKKMRLDTRNYLIEYFREPNQNLFEMLGIRYNWDH